MLRGAQSVVKGEVEVEEEVEVEVEEIKIADEKFFFSGTPTTQTRRAERDTIQPTTNAARAEFIAETELNKMHHAGRQAERQYMMKRCGQRRDGGTNPGTVSTIFFFLLHAQFVS